MHPTNSFVNRSDRVSESFHGHEFRKWPNPWGVFLEASHLQNHCSQKNPFGWLFHDYKCGSWSILRPCQSKSLIALLSGTTAMGEYRGPAICHFELQNEHNTRVQNHQTINDFKHKEESSIDIQWCQQNRPSYSNPLHTDYPGILHKDQGVAMIHPAATIGSPGLKLAEDTIHMNLEGLTYAKLPSNHKSFQPRLAKNLSFFVCFSVVKTSQLTWSLQKFDSKSHFSHLRQTISIQLGIQDPPGEVGKKFNGEVANPTLKKVIQRWWFRNPKQPLFGCKNPYE